MQLFSRRDCTLVLANLTLLKRINRHYCWKALPPVCRILLSEPQGGTDNVKNKVPNQHRIDIHHSNGAGQYCFRCASIGGTTRSSASTSVGRSRWMDRQL